MDQRRSADILLTWGGGLAPAPPFEKEPTHALPQVGRSARSDWSASPSSCSSWASPSSGSCAWRNAALGAEHADRGRQALERGDEDAALAEYGEAVRLNPRSADALLARRGCWCGTIAPTRPRPTARRPSPWPRATPVSSSAAGRRILNSASTGTMRPSSTARSPTPRSAPPRPRRRRAPPRPRPGSLREVRLPRRRRRPG